MIHGLKPRLYWAMLLTACFGCSDDTQGSSPMQDASADGVQAAATGGASSGSSTASGGAQGSEGSSTMGNPSASSVSAAQSSSSSTGSGVFGGFGVTTGGNSGGNGPGNTSASETGASTSASNTSASNTSASNTSASNTSASNTSTTGGSSTNDCEAWPTPTDNESVSTTIPVSGMYDGEFKRFSGSGPLGSSGQSEDQGPLFELAPGATLRNVILGNPAADGIHCQGNCTLENVWWEDVGEDAATFYGSSGSTSSTVRCGGARNADDKIFQHNGAGTVTIQDFVAESFGKLYRSCGNCSNQYERHVVLERITASGGSALAGINTNYGDTATFSDITVMGNITICQRYTGNNSGAEPIQTGSGPDGQYCLYDNSDITTR